MSWGIDFKTNIFLNKISFNKHNELQEVSDCILEHEQICKDAETLIKMYASSNVADIVPSDWEDDKIGYINFSLNPILENLEDERFILFQLRLYKQYLEDNLEKNKNE